MPYGYPYGYPNTGYPQYTQPGTAGMLYQPQQSMQTARPMQTSPEEMQQNGRPAQPNIICRPVASLEEAKAVPTDFTGALLVLTDFSHGAIYTKSLNYQDGSAIFKTYRMEGYNDNPPATVQQVPEYAEKKDLDALSARLDELTKVVGGIKNVGHTRAAGAKANAEQQPSD